MMTVKSSLLLLEYFLQIIFCDKIKNNNIKYQLQTDEES